MLNLCHGLGCQRCSRGVSDCHVHPFRAGSENGINIFFWADDRLHVGFAQDTSAPLLMLNCRACLWRCIQALDAPASNAHRLRRDVNPVFLPSQQRQLSTRRDVVRRSETRPTQLAEVEKLSRQGQEPWRNSAVAANQKQRERAALRPQPGSEKLEQSERVHETPNLAKLGRRDPTMSERDWFNRKQELRYLQDPLELATFVRRELGKGRVTEMLQLVRMASHSMQCVVSWNHIIDHYLANERVGDALKVYNDVCWSCSQGMGNNADTNPDEKAGTVPRLVYLYHHSTRPIDQRTPVRSFE
jgi:hypothetical protein